MKKITAILTFKQIPDNWDAEDVHRELSPMMHALSKDINSDAMVPFTLHSFRVAEHVDQTTDEKF